VDRRPTTKRTDIHDSSAYNLLVDGDGSMIVIAGSHIHRAKSQDPHYVLARYPSPGSSAPVVYEKTAFDPNMALDASARVFLAQGRDLTRLNYNLRPMPSFGTGGKSLWISIQQQSLCRVMAGSWLMALRLLTHRK